MGSYHAKWLKRPKVAEESNDNLIKDKDGRHGQDIRTKDTDVQAKMKKHMVYLMAKTRTVPLNQEPSFVSAPYIFGDEKHWTPINWWYMLDSIWVIKNDGHLINIYEWSLDGWNSKECQNTAADAAGWEGVGMPGASCFSPNGHKLEAPVYTIYIHIHPYTPFSDTLFSRTGKFIGKLNTWVFEVLTDF